MCPLLTEFKSYQLSTAHHRHGKQAAGRALDESTLALALTALEQDRATAGGGKSPHFGAPGFRVQLMLALLYKFFHVHACHLLPCSFDPVQ